MEASIVDLRYKMKSILQALDRNERVTILYHGKKKGVIIPQEPTSRMAVKDHPYFGMLKEKGEKTVEDVMAELRGDRY